MVCRDAAERAVMACVQEPWAEHRIELGLPEKASPGEKAAKLNELGSRQKILTLQSVDT
jgi:hypothetical protein